MFNPQWLELPMSRTIFGGPKHVQAIEVRLYFSMPVDANFNRVLDSYFSVKIYVVGTHLKVLSEVLLMGTRHVFVEK